MNAILILVLASMLTAPPSQDSSVSLKDLRNAPTQVVVNSRSLQLSAYPWRDFMPGSPGWGPNGSPLMVAVKITSADKQALPSGIRMERVWVLYGEESWEVSDLRGRKPGQDGDNEGWIRCSTLPVCEVTVRDGPKWGPGVDVDVVVRLSDSEGRTYLLQAPNQKIQHSI